MIEAVKITKDMSLYDLATELDMIESPYFIDEAPDGGFLISNREGDMTANVGDYVIKGIENELYPCKPDIFEKTYEEVNDGSRLA